jgi:hypothetical protein
MFGPWIPQALEQIAALAQLPERPDSVAITRARTEIVNMSASWPAPDIFAWNTREGCGVQISFSRHGQLLGGVNVWPNGLTMDSR